MSACATHTDPSIWRATAGAAVEIPTVNSRVYYFPQGHLEHSSPVRNNNILLKTHLISCQVLAVSFLSDPSFDQPFAKLRLLPLQSHGQHVITKNVEKREMDESDVVSFAKILTPSDSNNGGGFSVPRFCADLIFPLLDLSAEPPVQNLVIKDSQNNAWKFRHIYRGTPRRHLITTGWSRFVNSKRLVAGDSVVFMRKKSTGELFVGIRRAVREIVSVWNYPMAVENSTVKSEYGNNCNGGDGKEKEVIEAIETAEKGMAFEVVYYPRTGIPDFVVSAEKVEDSLSFCWSVGMRVKMAVETEDSSRTTWFLGTISSMTSSGGVPGGYSPWRMLEVTWDEPEVLQNVKTVSPWQVECVLPEPQFHSALPPLKKFKVQKTPGKLPDGEGVLSSPTTESTDLMIGQLNSSMFSYNSFPAGMQGARLDQFCATLSNSHSDNSLQTSTNYMKNGTQPELKISTELNIGSSRVDNLSSDSQSSVNLSSTELVGKQGSVSSFQLFGKIIPTVESVEACSDNNVSCAEGERNALYSESDAVIDKQGPSSTDSSSELLDHS
ncbi:auxin response factor 17 [Olea europaea subsp. europaea]|uniref:Auxin response factor n=1 Tax=Olea europaea subsp. europaea TaxID=158383 RepID=A0A8S0V6M4_OLEEU|nr:auxin response factor 17 [Olea europaea subsp. europaea]